MCYGSDFISEHIEQACIALKIRLIHSLPGRPRGRGKIERLFRTINDMFLPAMPDSLEQLDMLLVHVPKPRKVLRDGIRLMGRRYVEPTLAAFVGEQVEAVYDPRDLTEIHVYDQGRFVCRALSSEHAGHPSLRAIQRAPCRAGRGH
ncbi:Mu transposase C-terminal domain-containing protein [Sphingomonas paucimobilis]|uniref:Mu transposase C-terminal domain-containing protein n=1 Tax=Sphingomonas paucimobilis TaxID=13689 RepID=UPI0037A99B4F